MKKAAILFALLCTTALSAQKLATRDGYIKFYSHAAVEDIEAENNQVSSVLDMSTGNFAFLVPIKGFVFEKALMQEHFNENYMESGQFPKATFKGSIENYESIDLNKDGTYNVTFKGTMNIHGTDKEIAEEASFVVKEGTYKLNATFNLSPEDYGVKIPASKKDNISSTLELTVKMDYAKK